MKVAVEQIFNGSLDQVAIGGAYDAAKINRGKHTGQFNLGPATLDKFIGPAPLGVANFGESSFAVAASMVHPVQIGPDLFWLFAADGATAAATRRVQLWTWVPSTNTYALIGAITCTFPTVTAHTVRGLRAVLENYTTGTVGVSGPAVTGNGTQFLTQCVGSRIGFGSTDPNQISQWFQIAAIGSDTGITLTSDAGTIAPGTPFVIQDLMVVQATTNATGTNGGLFVTKGLSVADFTNPSTTIPAATTVDKVKAVYWLKDAATIANTAIGGCALGGRDDWAQQYVYATDGAATSLRIYRYNIRAALTGLAAGAQTLTGGNIVVTGAQTVTGNVSQGNNGRVATLQHGPGAGVACLYLLTSSRILRVPLANILAGSTSFIADQMSEVPPGGVNTNVATGTNPFISFDVSQSLDKLVIAAAVSSGTIYITDYYTTGQIDRRAGCLTAQSASANRDMDSPVFVHNILGNVAQIWVEDGWLFWLYSNGTAANLNAMTAYPLAADLEFLADVPNRIICPKILLGATPARFYRVMVNAAQNLGSTTMGVGPDMFLLEYRTSGIDDNSGAWTVAPQDGDLSGVSAAESIQFAFRFRCAGVVMLPARVLSLALLYETDDGLPSQYQWRLAPPDSDPLNGIIGFAQVALFGGAVPLHIIEMYRADTNALVLTQASSGTTNGVFEYWDGADWVAGLGPDQVGTRRRFMPTGSIPGGVDLFAVLRLG